MVVVGWLGSLQAPAGARQGSKRKREAAEEEADGDGGGTHEQSILNVLMSPPTAFGGEALGMGFTLLRKFT